MIVPSDNFPSLPLRRRVSEVWSVRGLLFWAGIGLLLVGCVSSTLRALLTEWHALSVAVFVLLGLIIVPSRYWPMALLLGAGFYGLLRGASGLKERAVGLPVTWLDIASGASDPLIIIRAIGYHGSVPALLLVSFLLAAGSLALMAKSGILKPSRVAMAALEGAVLAALALPALWLTGRDVHAHARSLFPNIVLQLWEPHGQRLLARRVGPLEYIAFTYVAGQQDLVALTDLAVPEMPASQVKEAVSQYLQIQGLGALPNIVILHAESTFDPNQIFRLTEPVVLPLWTRGPQTVSLGPLRVNVIGGGTQVTQFELFTGTDTRQFGYFGFYSHLTLAPKLKNALPAELASRGYRTIASYPADPSWLGAGAAFAAYGFDKTYFAKDLRLSGDWSESDPDLVTRIIAEGVFERAHAPLFLYLSTLENHGPHPCAHFEVRSDFVTSFQGSAPFARDCALNEYIRRAASTSKAMRIVLNRLKRVEITTRRPYVLLVYGDHQPWSFTDGTYSVAGGLANAGDMQSFARFRQGDNQNITFYHLISSKTGVTIGHFNDAIPTTLLPALLSAYAARDESDLFQPINFLAFRKCGSDYRRSSCPIRDGVDRWSRAGVLKRHAAVR